MLAKYTQVLISILLALRLVHCRSTDFGSDDFNQLSATPPPPSPPGIRNWSNYSNRSILHSSDSFSSASPYWFVGAGISLFLCALLFGARQKDLSLTVLSNIFAESYNYYELESKNTVVGCESKSNENVISTHVEMDVYKCGPGYSRPQENYVLNRRRNCHPNLKMGS